MVDTVIRFAQKEDVKELISLCALHAEFEQSAYDPSSKEENLTSGLFSENPLLFCLVAEQHGKLIGYATYMKQYSTWDADFYIYMDCLFILADARGFGIGEKLITRIKEEGQNLGCDLIQWQTPNFNTRAMKFYERIGAQSKSKERYFLKIE